MHVGGAEVFIDLYKRLESAAIERYNLPSDGTAVSRLRELPEYRELRDELSYCRDVRNLLQHRYQLDGSFAVEPSEGMIRLMRRVLQKVEHPANCRDVAVDIARVYWRAPSDFVLPAMRVMRERGFAYVPVFDGEGRGRLVGVFGENAIFSYLIDDRAVIGEGCTFGSMERYLALGAQPPYRFAFLPYDAPLSDADTLIDCAFHHGKRVGMIFLTSDGLPGGEVRGILTPYDILVRGRDN